MAEVKSAPAITVLVADDHPVVRYGLRHLFEQAGDLTVVAEAGSAHQVIEQARQHCPRVIMVDAELPDRSGIEACEEILAGCPNTAVLILSPFDWDVYLARAWEANAAGFIVKTAETDELLQAVRQAANGDRLFSVEQLQRIWAWRREVTRRLERLTPREQEVLELLALGYTNPEIAEAFVISEKTVETHVSHILGKLEMSSRRKVMAWLRRTRALVPYHLDFDTSPKLYAVSDTHFDDFPT